MKVTLPSEDTLLSLSALAAGGLAAQVRAMPCLGLRTVKRSLRQQAPDWRRLSPIHQFALAPRATNDALFSSPTPAITWSTSNELPWQCAGVALAGHAAKDLTIAARSPKTTAESRNACQMAGWTWLAGSALSVGSALAKKGSCKEDTAYTGAAVMGALAATLLAKGYGLDGMEF